MSGTAGTSVGSPRTETRAGIDRTLRAPQGAPCPACGTPIEPGDRFCTACGKPVGAEPPGAAQAESSQRLFRCQNCGSEVATDPNQRSYVCPFCDSTYVVEFSRTDSSRQRPEFVIGFAVTAEKAREKFALWIRRNSWFRPGDLKLAQLAEKQKGVYLPFWGFSMLAESEWSASIGEHWYRTETYTTTDSKGNTVTRTRQVQETEWWPLAGKHHRYYSGFLVSGSKGLPQSEAERIKPFHLQALKRYDPYFLAGWLNEEYSIDRSQALTICQEEFRRRELSNVASFLPGDTHRSLEVATIFQYVESDLCLLPVYIASYRYGKRLYRFLINGQTGKVAGDKPWSARRIGLAVALLVAVIAILFFLLRYLGR